MGLKPESSFIGYKEFLFIPTGYEHKRTPVRVKLKKSSKPCFVYKKSSYYVAQLTYTSHYIHMLQHNRNIMGNAAINQPKPVLLLDKVSSWSFLSFILGEKSQNYRGMDSSSILC